MAVTIDSEKELVRGTQNFKGNRLNFLQIGLGTFSSFLSHKTESKEFSPALAWLLQAASDTSNQLCGVGVEPVPKYAQRYHRCVQKLPNCTVVNAAIGPETKQVELWVLTDDHIGALNQLSPKERKDCKDRIVYLENMSCVGQTHPLYKSNANKIAELFNVHVQMKPMQILALTYDQLAQMLNFSGTEVLMIDAEGHDCCILESMIAHCQAEGNDQAWPDIIQFETMGHADCKDGNWTEHNTIKTLEQHGYIVACTGNDTSLIRQPAFEALQTVPHFAKWAKGFYCGHCQIVGTEGMPYTWEYPDRGGAMCHSCSQRFHATSDHLVFGKSSSAQSTDKPHCQGSTSEESGGEQCCCNATVEFRQATDGNAYSWWEFLEWYAEGAEIAWNRAKICQASDSNAYFWSEFREWYAEDVETAWNTAE